MNGRLFLNCEIDPDFYYANLKTIALLFKEIIVWAPIEHKWYAADHTVADLDEAFVSQNGDKPILIPGGRDWYFDMARDMPHGSKDFRRRLGVEASRSQSILPMASRQKYFEYAEFIHRQPTWTEHVRAIGDHFLRGGQKRGDTMEAKLAWAKDQWPTLDADHIFLAELLMDLGACADLDNLQRTDGMSPLVNDHAIDGYKLLQQGILAQSNLKAAADTNIEHSPARDVFIDSRREKTIIQHVADIFQANRLPWSEIRRIRDLSGDKIRRYYRLNYNYNNNDLFLLGDRISRRLQLHVATEEIFKELIKVGHASLNTYINSHVAGYKDLYQCISELKTASKGNNILPNALKQVESLRPIITSSVSHYAPGGVHTGKLVSEAMDIAVASIHMDELLSKLVLKSTFAVSSVSRVAMIAKDSRDKVFSN